MKTTVTQNEIDHLIERATVQIDTVMEKCTIVTVRLESGFILTESSACVDPSNYDEKLGAEICMERIKNRLWELEGYCLQRRLAGA